MVFFKDLFKALNLLNLQFMGQFQVAVSQAQQFLSTQISLLINHA
jgi:hypothetical protein